MHKLLERQLRRFLGELEPAPEVRQLIAAIGEAYDAADADRALLERSLELTSRELMTRNAELRRQVADLRVAEAAQRESLALLTSFFDSSPFPIAIAISDGDVRFVAMNEPARRLPLVEGGPVAELLRGRTARVQSFEGTVQLAGRDRHLLVTMAPVTGLDGRVCTVFQDVTEVRQMEARLRLADRVASMGTVAAGVAHEINNPLAYAISNLEYIASTLARLPAAAADELDEPLRDARDGIERVRRIVRDMKLLSRPDDEQIDSVDLSQLLDSSISLAANEIRHRARLVRDYAPIGEITGNSGRLGQVFVNLLINAAQSIVEGAADRNEIRVAVRPEGNERVVVEIHDTGAGIPEAIRGRVFEPFFTTKPVRVGTGLGLAICHGIIAEMGGEITFDSAVGKGSVFRVALRAQPAVVTPEWKPHAPQPARSARVLIVDDEPFIGSSLKRVLSDHEVEATSSAREALRRIRSGVRYDVIVCDLMMPDMTGMELHAAIAALDPKLVESMIFITGGAFTQRAQEFLESVPNRRLDKPTDGDQLLAVIDEIMSDSGRCF